MGVEPEEPLGDLGQRGELGLLVDVLLAVLVLEEALQGGDHPEEQPCKS